MKQQIKSFTTQMSYETELDYLLYLPPDYDKDAPTPLILFLHGAGERGDDLTLVASQGLPKYLETHDIPAMVVSPQCPPDEMWNSYHSELIQLIDQISKAYTVDSRRVYLTGLSMGGYGTWDLARLNPERFAAIAPICGGIHHLIDLDRAVTLLQSMPIWTFHGALDEIVPISETQRIVDALEAVGADVQFTVYPDLNHDSWTRTYNNPDLYTWLFSHSIER